MSVQNTTQLLQNLHLTISGVINAPSVRVSTWQASTYYVVGRVVKPTVANGFYYEAQTSGTTGASQPTWPTTLGNTVVDGGVTWEAISDDDPFGYPNAELDKDDFPLVLVMPGEAQSRKLAGATESTRIYECWLFLYPQKSDFYPQARQDAPALIQRFIDTYTDPDNKVLNNPPYLVEINSHLPDGVRDSGLAELDYLSALYYGVRFLVSVYEYDNS
jgi:hypothetical protein